MADVVDGLRAKAEAAGVKIIFRSARRTSNVIRKMAA